MKPFKELFSIGNDKYKNEYSIINEIEINKNNRDEITTKICSLLHNDNWHNEVIFSNLL